MTISSNGFHDRLSATGIRLSSLPVPTLPSKPPLEDGEMRVAAPREYRSKLDNLRVVLETPVVMTGPGTTLGVLDRHSRLEEYRKTHDVPLTAGIRFDGTSDPVIEDVPHPESTPEKPVNWDPFAYMPRFVFEKGEDALPVSPAFDGDADLNNNASKTANGAGHYKDGVIGNDQALKGGFAVSQKGEYTVLDYSFYYATNKAGKYHTKDWSHAQVYLKPDASGELKPAYLYTSWHHGGILTPWEDVLKDAQGKPVIQVQLGSHATAPLGHDDAIPEDGLQIQGDGKAILDGKPIPHELTWEAFQGNVDNAAPLQPGTDDFMARLLTMRSGYVAFNPLMPEVFEKNGGFMNEVIDKVEPYVDKVEDKVKELGEKVSDTLKDVKDGIKNSAKSAWKSVFG